MIYTTSVNAIPFYLPPGFFTENSPEICSSPEKLLAIRATYKYWCALNVGTDLISSSLPRFPRNPQLTPPLTEVLALPLVMIYNLQLRPTQKATLTLLFSLGLLVAIVDILRTVESLQSGTFSGVALWSTLEVTIAVIVASLPLYRVLITRKGRQNLLSRLSMERYKHMDDDKSPEATERRFLDTNSGMEKEGKGTFRNDLETQDSAVWERREVMPLAHVAR